MEINLGKLPFDIDFHPSNPLVTAGLITGDLLLYRYAADSPPQRLLEVHAHSESCRAVRFINEGRAIVTGSPDCSILSTDVETGSAIARLENSHGAAVNRIINLTESTIASGDDEGCIKDCSDRFVDLSPNSVDALLKLDEDGVIAGSENGLISLLGILPNRIIQPIAEHSEYPVERLAFSHDKKFLGSISHDQTSKLWDMDDLLESSGSNLKSHSAVADSDSDEMDMDCLPKSSKGTKRKLASKGQGLGSSNYFLQTCSKNY